MEMAHPGFSSRFSPAIQNRQREPALKSGDHSRRLLVRLGTALLLLPILLDSCTRASAPILDISPTSSSTQPPASTATVPFTPTPTLTPTTTSTPTFFSTQTPYVITATSVKTSSPHGSFILSLPESGYTHLFIYSPLSLTLTRLTADPWHDITPAISPDGSQLAFASRRNGYWDLYLLTLATGEVTRLTDTLAYDASPTLSPDGLWLAYESYVNDNLEVFISSAIDPSQPQINMTRDSAADFSPAWSPQGHQVAYVSDRGGAAEIWLADLNRGTFIDVSKNRDGSAAHPAWSPDGTTLAWSFTDPSTRLANIQVWAPGAPETPPRSLGAGDWPVWMDATHIGGRITTPNDTYLAAYVVTSGDLSLPLMPLSVELRGLAYEMVILPNPLPGFLEHAASVTPAVRFHPVVSPPPGIPSGRSGLVPLEGVQAPYPQLQDVVDESFQALRQLVSAETGWDILGDLENAYVPLTTPLDPGLGEDWLYTGRAFSLVPAMLEAGLACVVREDFGEQTYWRLFIHTRAQDGSQGEPLHNLPWDFSTRYGNNPVAFEQGGSVMDAIPSGYWFDFTSLARQFGWERLPALSMWRTYFKGTRFNEFVEMEGFTWRDAMLEVYPPEALITPTTIIPPTRTPTRTPWGYKSPTPTHTSTPQPTYTTSP